MSFAQILEHISFLVEAIGCIIMLLGVVNSLAKFLKAQLEFFRSGVSFKPMQMVRLELGIYLLLGLEFMIVGDIIATILKPGMDELIYLVVIVIVRTAIGYFLGKELESVAKETKEKN